MTDNLNLTIDPYRAMAAAQFKVPYDDVTKQQRHTIKQAWWLGHFKRNRNRIVTIERETLVFEGNATPLVHAYIQPEDLPIIAGTPKAYEGWGTTPTAALHNLADAIPADGRTRVGWPEDDTMPPLGAVLKSLA